ncbi:GntR family transcriptional regulator [uncultured Paludibaculum sp.]|uniref:GntR family transcriptional regulator n=1 Tax=uncultured Paludibaculum sp. TaxID=1765020 RepID=UPI002AABD9AB|nr:GntR family transcriptional regulator [uncultured Paludibaculum sp.]
MLYITSMQLNVHPGAEVPIYRQIMRQITEAVAGGRLRPGDKLTSHRDLAEELVIAPLTVKKAYDELELAGLIETVRGRGTFVVERPPLPSPDERRIHLREHARRFLTQAFLDRLSWQEALEVLQEARTEIEGAQASQQETEQNHE